MSIGSSAGATYQRPQKGEADNYPFEVGINTIPQADPNNRKVISQGPSVCIFKKTNAQEEAASWLFVKYLTTNVDFQAEFSMASGYVPVIKSVAENPVYAEFLANADGGNYISALSAKVCLEQQEAYYTSPAFVGSSVARDAVGSLLIKCLTIADGTDEPCDRCRYQVPRDSGPIWPKTNLTEYRGLEEAFRRLNNRYKLTFARPKKAQRREGGGVGLYRKVRDGLRVPSLVLGHPAVPRRGLRHLLALDGAGDNVTVDIEAASHEKAAADASDDLCVHVLVLPSEIFCSRR
jgi:hypothetical protein